MKVHISKKNSKLGKISNISLPPAQTCCKDIPCKQDCYAQKAYHRWKNVRFAWDENLKLFITNPTKYWNEICKYLYKQEVKHFRWHVGGDILHQEYFDNMDEIALLFPKTKFLCFTKNYDLDFADPAPNLSIVISIWPKLPLPKKIDLPFAFMQDGTETRVKNAVECKGHCSSCFRCWNLKNKNVVFNLH